MDSWITPYLPLIGILLGGLIVGGFGVWNRKRGAVEGKVPTIGEVWAEQRLLRSEVDGLRRDIRHKDRALDAMVTAFEGLREAFKSFAARVQRGGSSNLTKSEKAALELPVVSDEDWPTEPHRSNP